MASDGLQQCKSGITPPTNHALFFSGFLCPLLFCTLTCLLIYLHPLSNNCLIPISSFKKTQSLLTSSFWPSLSSVLSNSLPFSLIWSTFVYKHIFFLLVCSKIIIAVRWLYHQSPCHYQSIETLPADFMSLSENSHIIFTVSMPLSEYRHIISRLHVIIRVSSHYQQTPRHY